MGSIAVTGWLALAALAFFICYQDISKREISNHIVLLVSAISFMLLLNQQNYAVLPYSALLLLSGFILFQLNIIAAGDIKLLTAFSLAINPQYLLLTLVLIGFCGGALGGGYYLLGLLTDLEKVKQRGIPYGIPICAGCLFGIAASL